MDNKKRVTSYDVAREAGVSQSAVSRVFRPGLSVSKKTREKVLATAEKMGYKPNAIARMLITQSSGMIAVIVSSRANLNYPDVLSLLNKRIAEANKRVLLFTLDDVEGLDDILDHLWTYQVDGVIALAAHFDHNSISQFEQHHIPVVLYNRQVDDHSVSSVSCNHELGLRQLVDLLVKHQHKDYLIISGPKDSDVATDRRNYAIQALANHHITDVPVVFGDYTYESGRLALSTYLQHNKRPTAIICGNDNMAIGVVDEAKQNFALSVPEDLSVVGFDGINAATWFSYQITTIRQPASQMTKAAVDILLDQIENKHSIAETRIWSGELIEGTSVAGAKMNVPVTK